MPKRMTLAQAIEACKDAREECDRLITKVARGDGIKYPWRRSREPVLLAIDAHGDRICGTDGGNVAWRRRMKDVDALLAHKDADQIVRIAIDSGINFAETKAELENTSYGIEFWSVDIWSRENA